MYEVDPGFRIRDAGTGDIESVLALGREMDTLPHWRASDYLAALPIVDGDTENGGRYRCFFVAEIDATLVGFAVGTVTIAEAVAELESVGVAQQVRRLGIGRGLCAAVIDWSEQMGAFQMILEVRSQSRGPIALYERLGFAAVGRRPNYYRDPDDDAILMRRDLAASGVSRPIGGRDL